VTVPFDARKAAEWSGGTIVSGDPAAILTGVCIDSRAVEPGDLFVAIVGPSHDAHEFLTAAAASGAGGLLVEKGRELPAELPNGLPAIAVDDTTRALGRLAKGHRSEFSGPVVAITGSNGKTTTKEMCAAILSAAMPCLKNEGNLNNHFGLPLTLLRRDDSHECVVVELGMNHRGEIAELADIARPTVGVITNVGTAHIEHLGSREEIALEKGDLIAALPEDAIAVLNADDPAVIAQADRTGARVVRYGTGPDADVRALDPTPSDDCGWKFELIAPAGRIAVEVPGLGETAWRNALAAAAGALCAGAPLEQVATGLARHQPIGGRLVPVALSSGATLIDDTYNANPQSMEVALRLLAGLSEHGRSFAVVGDMGELGETTRAAHRATGELAAALGIDFLFALGDHAGETISAARSGGVPEARAVVGETAEAVAAQISSALEAGDHILVKGSRAMRMERVVQLLTSHDRPTVERT